MHAPSPLPGAEPQAWPVTAARRGQRQLAQISAVALVANLGGILGSIIYCLVIGKWWGIFLAWIAFSLGPIKIGRWPTVAAAVLLWMIGLPLVAVLVIVTLPIEMLLVAQERRLGRESIALGDSSQGHHRPEAAHTGNLSTSAVEDSIRAVLGESETASPVAARIELQILWQDVRYADRPPALATNAHGLVCGDEIGLRLLDARSGDEQWRVDALQARSPHAVIAAGSDFLVYYRMDRIEDDVVARVAGSDGAMLWQRRQARSPDPVACGEQSVVVDDRFVMLVDVDGEVVWSTAPFHLGPRELACDGTRIAALDLSNRVSVISVDGGMLWRMRLDENMRNAALDDGRRRVTAKLGGRAVMLANLAIGDSQVVVSAEQGTVCFDADNGSVRWAARHGGGWTRPHIAAERVLLTLPAELVALDLETGQVAWRRELADHPITGASSCQGHAILSGRRELHRFTLRDGEHQSVPLGAALSPRDADEAEAAAKVMRRLTPVTSDSGEVFVWTAGTGVTAIAS